MRNCFIRTVGQAERCDESKWDIFCDFSLQMRQIYRERQMKVQKVKSQCRGTDLPPQRVRREAGWIEYSVSLGAKPYVSPDLVPRDPVIRSELTSFIILMCVTRCRQGSSNLQSYSNSIHTGVFHFNVISFCQSIIFSNPDVS
jgi:hypothetical protein